ncbi:hypothetical protein Fmac_032801 [Flemingia macrophylla]|uniref:Uncharacterized protein n=1 Tax=Flemingia macrophylla TaxID=520843 RepID=A0ABD1L5Y3_9FABA
MTTILVSVLIPSNLEWMSILRLMLQTPIAGHHSSRDNALHSGDGSQLLAQFSARNDPIITRGVHNVAIDTSAENRKLEGKLDALVNLVTQLAANQKPASVARVCGLRSSNDHHTIQFSAGNDAIVIRGVYDVVTDTSAETRKLEGKLDALVNLVTQLATNQKPATVARVCNCLQPPFFQLTFILVSVLLRSYLEWMSILRLMLQIPIAGHHSRRDKALDREDCSQLLAV